METRTAPLSEQIANHIELTPVDSSQLKAAGHDPETNTLAIQFVGKPGEDSPIYHYFNCTAKDYEALLAAESIGGHFGIHIKRKYDYQRIEPTTGVRKLADPVAEQVETKAAA